MASVQFNGHYQLTYVDHLDTSTGKTLVAVPGQSYTTAAAPGRNPGLPSVPGDGRWGASGLAEPYWPRLETELAEATLSPDPSPVPDDGDVPETIPDAPEETPGEPETTTTPAPAEGAVSPEGEE